jgi:PAS domain S-box-containing protein
MRRAESIITPELKKTIPWRLAVIFLLFSVAIILMGIYYYKSQRNQIFAEQEKNLSAIATLKIDQIEQWHKERLGDAKVIKENEPLIDQINLFFRDKNKSVIKRELEKWMKSVYKYGDYSSVLLVDTSLKVRLSVLPYDTVAGDAIHEQLQNVISKNIIVMTDLHRSTSVNYVHLDLIIPLQESGKEEKKPFGLLILRIDPTKMLFPLIQSWPTSSKSSETLLLRKEKDSILYLNELRHQKNTALNLRLPLSNRSLLGSRAAEGYEGVYEGIDYRNIPVVGYLKHIPGLQWYMVAKVDKNEIQAPMKNQFYIAVFGIILLILINASVFGFWIRDQRLKMYRLQLKDEIAIRESKEKLIESEELFRSLFENMLDGFAYCKMLYTDGHPLDFIYINVNEAFESLTGLKNVKGKKVSEVIPGIQEADPELLETYNRVALTGNPEVFETYVESLKMWLAISLYSPQKEYFVAVFDVITKRKFAEEALRENEKRLREAQEMAHLGFWLWDIKSGNVEWSEEVFKIFCLDPETFTPKIDSILELSPWPEDNQRDKELISRAIETHNPGTYEQKFLRPDQSIGYYYSTFRGNYDNNGDLVSIVGTVLDITDRKLAEVALRESEDKFKYIFDHSVIGKSITFPTGEIHVNMTFCDMLGYKQEELEKTKWQIITHPDDIEMTEAALRSILSGEKDSVRFIKRYLHKNGSVVWTDVGTALRRDKNGNPLYFMTAIINITDRKNAEEALRELNDELELRVAQRTAQMKAANKELEAFSYSVSHDLRAPLRSVHSYTKILLEEYEDKLDAEGKRICGIICSSATQMGGLIDDLLSFSRIGRSSLNQGVINMNSLAATVFTDISNEKEKARTNLKIEKLHKAYGDQSLIKQVWNNLISNALKYSSKEITPEISIGSSKKGEIITYFIKDNGVGFDMQYAHKLFGVFQRLHSEAEFEGNGVGLAIVERIILKHGGRVWAEGETGKGATFYFALPVQDINKKTHDTRYTTHG